MNIQKTRGGNRNPVAKVNRKLWDCEPLWHGSPRSMLIGQNVEDLLFQLVCSDVVSVLGSTDQVIAHLLLFPPVCGVLGTVGLLRKKKGNYLHMVESLLYFMQLKQLTMNPRHSDPHRLTDLELCVFVNIFCSLPVEDKLCLIGDTDNVILHGVTKKPETKNQLEYVNDTNSLKLTLLFP